MSYCWKGEQPPEISGQSLLLKSRSSACALKESDMPIPPICGPMIKKIYNIDPNTDKNFRASITRSTLTMLAYMENKKNYYLNRC